MKTKYVNWLSVIEWRMLWNLENYTNWTPSWIYFQLLYAILMTVWWHLNNIIITNVGIEKLGLSTFENNEKLRWNVKNFIQYLRNELYTGKKGTNKLGAFRAFARTSFMALQIPVVSMEFSSFWILSIKHFRSFARQLLLYIFFFKLAHTFLTAVAVEPSALVDFLYLGCD
jgi:hypothetical protein